jgi:prepilin-type N-terminal cleavage/methylation domain-containing protein
MSHPSQHFNQRGFTVVELAISISVTGILLALIFGFMTSSLQQYSNDTNRANLINSAQAGFERITNDIRLSASADTNNRWPDTYAPVNTFGWTTDSDTLVLATAAEDTAGNIIFADPANYISQKNNVIYFLQNGTLYRRVIAASVANNSAKTTCPAANATATCKADRKILDNVKTFTIKYYDEQNVEVAPDDARAIELYAKLEKKAFSEPVSVDYKTRMVFRND